MLENKKVAIICDWLVTYAGAERVIEQLINIFPQADIFCVVDFLTDKERFFLKNKKTTTTFIQNMPGAEKNYQIYLPLMPIAIEQLDVTDYDIVISSSHAVAKGVITGPTQIHISYVHTPIRYAWDLQYQYLKETGMEHGIKSLFARLGLHYIRMWDCRTANGVDEFVANSKFIAKRIKKVYGRNADVIYPPVDVFKFDLCRDKRNYYLTASRMVPYKKISLIVKAFNEMPDKKLVVIGDGPELGKIRKIAKGNIEILGWQPDDVLTKMMEHARAFIFAAEEDFGIVPVEAQACGTPVIAYGRGGALETIRSENDDTPTGVFFYQQTVSSLCEAVCRFEKIANTISCAECRNNAFRFSKEKFVARFTEFVSNVVGYE